MHVVIIADIEPQVDTFVYGKAGHQSMLMVNMSSYRAHPIRRKNVI